MHGDYEYRIRYLLVVLLYLRVPAVGDARGVVLVVLILTTVLFHLEAAGFVVILPIATGAAIIRA